MSKIKENRQNILKPKEQLFIENYTNPNSPTFSNGTQSYLLNNDVQADSARALSSRMLARVNVQDSITQNIQDLGLESKVRLSVIKDIVTGNDIQETVTTSEDKDGNKYIASTLKSPTAMDKLRAIDLLGKIDGTYSKQKVAADLVSTELKQLIRKHRKAIQDPKQGTGEGGKTPPHDT